MATRSLAERKMTKTISLKGSTIMMLEEITDNMPGKNHSSMIEQLIEDCHKTMFKDVSHV